MGNVDSVSKKSKNFSSFLDEKWPECFFGKNHHNTLLTVKAYCKDSTEKYTLCLLENPKFESFIANNSPTRNFRRLKVWSMIDRVPVLVFIQNWDESGQ